eukprot:TRINITY_DN12897_c0_g1_i1.p2 TRINITY_DN12897_c0_g1~~TRINITY_DN12897_c0_g1_i1.p2  ORF type:complete len:218 (+),score=68.03 TRINITY_DN12897_c0_g1_i1:34-654(+)
MQFVAVAFGSVAARRANVLNMAVRMLSQMQNLAVVLVGAQGADVVSPDILRKIDTAVTESRFLETQSVDVAWLFSVCDACIVPGTLPFVARALRSGKPTAVVGPLTNEQRFWGTWVHAVGVGPQPSQTDKFGEVSSLFLHGAMSPDDPLGWRARAQEMAGLLRDRGGSDCVAQHFAFLLRKGLRAPAAVPGDAGSPLLRTGGVVSY